MKKQTAGRENLGAFAPQFAALNDDVLFGEVWSKEQELSPRDRSLITVASLLTQGVPQLEAHLKIAKENGVTKEEIVALITHLSFYAGWPKAWTAFQLAQEIFSEKE
jgi:4-carboxymuconolactone decarboxylase